MSGRECSNPACGTVDVSELSDDVAQHLDAAGAVDASEDLLAKRFVDLARAHAMRAG